MVEMWQCWRVWPGRADHDPANHQDPDLIPEGWGVPWALNGPTPQDQWPPPGLAPAPLPPPPPGEPPPPPPDLGLGEPPEPPVTPAPQPPRIPIKIP